MQVKPSSFLKIKAFLLLLIIFPLIDCSAEVWGLTEEVFRTRLQEDAEFLRHLDLEKLDGRDLFRLGPGAPYYISLLFKKLELNRMSTELLWLQWNRGKGIWKERAGVDILAQLLEQEDYAEVIRLSRAFLRRTKSFQHEAERIVLEAYYWQHEDEEVLQRLADMLDSGSAVNDPELLLFQAVANARLNKPEWPLDFQALFLSQRSSLLHARALAFLELEQRFQKIKPEFFEYYQAKVLLFQGRSAEAIESLEPLLPRLDRQILRENPILSELTGAYTVLNRQQQGADFLLALAESLIGKPRVDAFLLAGDLYRRAGMQEKAAGLYQKVAAESEDPRQRDRALWFLLDFSDSGLGLSLDTLDSVARSWDKPERFSTLLAEAIAQAVSRRDWVYLQRMSDIIRESGAVDIISQLDFILDRRPGAAGDHPKAGVDRFDPGSYHDWLDRGSGRLISLENDDNSVADLADDEALLWGYFEFGLFERGYELIRDQPETRPELVLKAAGALNREGYFIQSIRLMNLIPQVRSSQALRLRYPRGYLADIRRLAVEEEVPEWLLFALVREESHFDARIESRAGAVGLTQLMPETAEDMARLMRIRDYDIYDPLTNLKFGVHHFSRLLYRLESIPKALMAYNAGLSRVRRWERQYEGFPDHLLAEALPYPETRHYLRKILVSAIYYGYLYQQQDPWKTVLTFFPKLEDG